MSHITRLPRYSDITSAGARDAVKAEVTLHDPDGNEYRMVVLAGFPAHVVPAAKRAAESLHMDLEVSKWTVAA